ncbi:MAG: DNA starvation/stationary phase protection protein Dps [Planctomycetia bacterium]|nr:DNA starvation/stationary phase protection protein Dps [Planctomycetia bacterium]
MSKRSGFSTANDLAADVREKSIALLNQHLADGIDLYSQIKQAHWNVKGLQFHQLHLLFDSLADEVEEHIDEIAERATALGGVALGTTRIAASASRLPEYDLGAVNGRQHLEALIARFAALAKTTRAAIDTAAGFGDADTADLFTGVSRGLDKNLWFLESHVQE